MKNETTEINFTDTLSKIGILFILFIITSFLICIYAITTVPKEASKYIDNVLETHAKATSNALTSADKILSNEISHNLNINTVNYQTGTIDSLYAQKNLKNLLVSIQQNSEFNTRFVVHFKEHNITMDGNDTPENYKEWDKIKLDYIEMIKDPSLKYNAWNLLKLGDDYLLVKLYNINNVLTAASMYVDDVIDTFSTENLGEESYFLLLDANNKPASNIVNTIPKENKLSVFSLSTKPISIITNIENTNYKLASVFNHYTDTINILKLQIVFLFIIVLITIIAIYMVLYIHKRVLQPIIDFSKDIDELAKDSTYSVITHYKIAELKNASELLSNFVEQINKLKINIYEQTLEKQKVQLDFLSLQIEPHFFLNCLNTIYHMAAIGKYKEIQELSGNISEYLRYIFKNRDDFVTLDMEIKHTEKYLDIQKIRYQEGFNVNVDITEQALNEKIPPLIIQTFVENIIKHAIDWEDSIEIFIGGKINNENFLELIIEDTGDGFNEEVLNKLQNSIDISKGEKSIGIMNAIKRVMILYNGEAKIDFYNKETNGAGIKIVLPLNIKGDE